MNRQIHWEKVYQTKDYTKVGWHQKIPRDSLKIFKQNKILKSASIIDIGAGASLLVDELVNQNFTNLTILDISEEALTIVKKRLGTRHQAINYIIDDITKVKLIHSYDVWHDRATFHFLQTKEEQEAYIQTMHNALNNNGLAVIATFSVEGPNSCSTLKVKQYDYEEMDKVLKQRFAIVDTQKIVHITPGGDEHKFCYFVLKPNYIMPN